MNQYLLSVYEADGKVEGAHVRVRWCTARARRRHRCPQGTKLDKVVTDGPFAEAKEYIGGFYIINAESLDDALKWADKAVEAINHSIEVRPFRATGRARA